MAQIPSDPELGPIESALVKLTPARIQIDRDRLMFQAGAKAALGDTRRRWVWPSIAAALALVAASESLVLAIRPAPKALVQQPSPPAEDRSSSPAPVQILAQSPSPAEKEAWTSAEPLNLRRQVLRHGLEGLPALPPLLSQSDGPDQGPAAKLQSPAPLRRYELNKLLTPGGPS
jgi:hypothetical protein